MSGAGAISLGKTNTPEFGAGSAYLISATGLPALSVPAGFTPEGLPVGLQLVGRRRADWELLQVAHAFESATGHGSIAPALP